MKMSQNIMNIVADSIKYFIGSFTYFDQLITEYRFILSSVSNDREV